MLGCLAGPASAIVAQVTISNGSATDTVPVTLMNPDPNNPSFYAGGGMSNVVGEWSMNTPFFVTAELSSGMAVINSVMGLKSESDATEAFVVTFEVPVTSPLTSPYSSGHSLVGASGFGQLTSSGNAPLYTALVDGAAVSGFELLPAVQTINLGGGGSGQVGPASFGDPTLVPGVSISSSIGMMWQFDITPGDAASWNSNFQNVVVPEPGSCGLLALGAMALAGLTIRRRMR